MLKNIVIFFCMLLLHLYLCRPLYLGILSGRLRVRKFMFFVALFLPFWGPLTVLALSYQVSIRQTDVKAIGVEKFKQNSELYKSILRDTSRASDATVSMEEALIVNSAKERRALIMDVLNDNPKDYVEFLKKAGNNEDTEVVHYAVTAMVGLSKENDEALWQLEKQYSQSKDDPEILTEYCSFLWSCLEQGLMQGQVEKMNRNLYDDLIQKKIRNAKPTIADYISCVKNCIALGNYAEADRMLEQARRIWAKNEELLILKIECAAAQHQADTIKGILAEIERENIFLSGRAKEVIAFWKE